MPPFEMIKAHLSTAVPFATHTGIVIDTVGASTARAAQTMRHEVSNHIGAPHAGAVFTLAEAASGAAMADAFAEILHTLRPVAAEASIAYLIPARGTLEAEARTGQTPDALRAILQAEGKVSFPTAARCRASPCSAIAARCSSASSTPAAAGRTATACRARR